MAPFGWGAAERELIELSSFTFTRINKPFSIAGLSLGRCELSVQLAVLGAWPNVGRVANIPSEKDAALYPV